MKPCTELVELLKQNNASRTEVLNLENAVEMRSPIMFFEHLYWALRSIVENPRAQESLANAGVENLIKECKNHLEA